MLGALDADVIVVGAGIAGLAAADYLATSGKSVTIMEGRGRVGGRILTDFPARHADLPVELGAEFVHGRHPLLLSAVKDAGLRLSPVEGRPYRTRHGRLSPEESTAGFDEILGSPDLLQNDIPFSGFIAHAPATDEQRVDVTSYVEGFNGAFADRIGTRSLYHQQQAEGRIEGDSSSRIETGYQSLVRSYEERLQQSAHLMLGAVVRQVEWRRGHVRVTAVSNGQPIHLTSRAAVITVPLGVLLGRSPSASIAFSPEPEMLHKLALLDPGWAMRLNLVFSEPVWADVAPDAGFIFSEQQHFPVWWTRPHGSGYLLTGWNGGPKAAALASTPQDELLQTALQTLSVLMNRKTKDFVSKLESVHYHNWHTDPFSLGAYSYVTAGGFEFSQTVGRPVENTLWFAGEAMASEGYWGTVHGALASGRRAAAEIVARG
jgi:monoamine oxidase